jgi:CBS domain containing-hemolysin-like protein
MFRADGPKLNVGTKGRKAKLTKQEFCLVSLAFLPFVPTFNFGPSAPIAYPIAKILDYVLGAGRHPTYKRAELKTFLQFHHTGEEPLRDEELVILNGVLELNTKEVERIMTSLRVGYHFVGTDCSPY